MGVYHCGCPERRSLHCCRKWGSLSSGYFRGASMINRTLSRADVENNFPDYNK